MGDKNNKPANTENNQAKKIITSEEAYPLSVYYSFLGIFILGCGYFSYQRETLVLMLPALIVTLLIYSKVRDIHKYGITPAHEKPEPSFDESL